MPKRIYIAGPMRGLPQYNFPAFDKARDEWMARGWEVVSPADMDRELDGFDENDPDAAVHPIEHYMRRDIEALLTVDAVAFLDNWRTSSGARVEWVVAKALGLELYQARTGEPLRSGPITIMQQHQNQVRKGMVVPDRMNKLERVAHAALGLTGEAGEVADLVKKSQYQRNGGVIDKVKLREELGDVLWYLQYLASYCDASLEDLAVENMYKLTVRYNDRYLPIHQFRVI